MAEIGVLLLVGLVVLVTYTLEAVTGFGCTVMAFPFVILLMNDLEEAKIILSVLTWLLSVYFVITKHKDINWKQFGIILLFAGIGLPAGMVLFKHFDAVVLTKALGVFIVLSAAIQLYKCFRQSDTLRLPSFMGYFFLLCGGIVHGAFAVGGPLIVLYSARNIPDKGQFRATMCLLWTTLNTILMIQFFLEKKFTLGIGCDLLFLFPFLIAGIAAGEFIHNRVSGILFKKITFASLLLVGATMVM